MTDERELPEREQIAAIIGRMMGPPNGSRWMPNFVPKWPTDYSVQEQRELVHCADMIIASRRHVQA